MKILICYEDGHAPVATKCRVLGFSSNAGPVPNGWIVYAAYDIPDLPRLAPALVESLEKFEVEYSDPTFAKEVPESANVTAGLLDMILARSDFAEVPYTSRTRQWRSAFWTEIRRRAIPVSELREP